MRFRIEYCVEWNYLPEATGLAAALKKRYAAETELIKGGKGVFKVWENDRLLFSKKDVGRFPRHEEIFDKVGAGS